MGLQEELKELQRKAEGYNILKKNCEQAEANVGSALIELNKCLKALNPITKINTINNGSDNIKNTRIINRKEILAGLYERMKSGESITEEKMVKEHPELKRTQVQSLIYSTKGLKHMKDVKRTNIDGTYNYYV